MTTETISLQQLCKTARANSNDNLLKVACVAWDMLEEIDPRCEWSDQSVADVIMCVRSVDSEIADEFETETQKAA